jgi:hypothetical protein
MRYLGMVVEALAHGISTFNSVRKDRLPLAFDVIARLGDAIEHVAQYALDGLAECTRADHLARTVDALARLLAELADDMPPVGQVPSCADLARLHAALERFVGAEPTSRPDLPSAIA